MTGTAIDTKAAVEVAKGAAGILPKEGKTTVLEYLVSSMTPEALKALAPEAREKLLQALGGTAATPSSTQSQAVSEIKSIGRRRVVGQISINGQQLDTLLSDGSFGKSRSDQHEYAAQLGYRMATRGENRAYVEGLLAKEGNGTINDAEEVALQFYRWYTVRDTAGALDVDVRRVRDYNSGRWLYCAHPDDGALFVRASGEDVSTSAGVTTAQKTSLQIAEEMVKSYAFDKKTGVSTFTVPAGVTDVDAMRALNEYFRKNHSTLNRDAVYAVHLEWFEKLPQKFPAHCERRDYSQARQITITGVVKGTRRENRTTQGSVLDGESLVFSDPRDQALAAAIHACRHQGADLFKNLRVRGSVPGFALGTGQSWGVSVHRASDVLENGRSAASGSPSPELK
jgi:hypothetical protein